MGSTVSKVSWVPLRVRVVAASRVSRLSRVAYVSKASMGVLVNSTVSSVAGESTVSKVFRVSEVYGSKTNRHLK